MTCTFDDKEINRESDPGDVIESLVAPKELQSHHGNETNSTVSLTLTDVLGNAVPSDNVPLGKKVLLVARTDGAGGEQGIYPISCDAVSDSAGVRYAVLRAGCGDGIVLRKSAGFSTTGRTTTSPYFKVFDLGIGHHIRFQCNFSLCEGTCDGSTCRLSRRKRFVYQTDIHNADSYVFKRHDSETSPRPITVTSRSDSTMSFSRKTVTPSRQRYFTVNERDRLRGKRKLWHYFTLSLLSVYIILFFTISLVICHRNTSKRDT